jgi:hypothetical protein
MLEHPSLLILPWAVATGPRPTPSVSRRRSILDPDTGRLLGFAGRRPVRLPWGLRWLARTALEIHETEDESLLFTLCGPWLTLRAWEVFDSEDHLVGSLRGNLVRDRQGRTLAVVQQCPAATFRFLTPENVELGSLLPNGRGNRITFSEELVGDPFARMLLLAGGLALTHSRP